MTPLHAPGNWYEGDSGGVKGQQNLGRSAVPGGKRGVENSRCSNCLAKDHRAAHCREPKRCWKCKALGHLSFNCKAACISSSQLCCAPSPAPCQQNQFFPSIPPSETTMERRRSIRGRSDHRASPPAREEGGYPRERERESSAINYPGNPRFRPRVAFKMLAASRDMVDKRNMMDHFALVAQEIGALSLASTEELKDILLHHFGIRKHEVYIYHSRPDPFVIIFSEQHSRDLVFGAGRFIDGPVELSFHAWDLDEFGERAIIPYHIRLSIEGIPHHAWYQEIADKVIYDEAIIHHVEEESRRRTDLRAYRCWAFSKDPSKIPQTVFLTITEPGPNLLTAQVHFVPLRETVKGCV
jgi:hypothetical protein